MHKCNVLFISQSSSSEISRMGHTSSSSSSQSPSLEITSCSSDHSKISVFTVIMFSNVHWACGSDNGTSMGISFPNKDPNTNSLFSSPQTLFHRIHLSPLTLILRFLVSVTLYQPQHFVYSFR